ncbi:hypothetical protein HDU86_001254 [Geranomyces michiganensis]|nr:hypothetical protein HDU86_001254 [Geranomyces michiganensis]
MSTSPATARRRLNTPSKAKNAPSSVPVASSPTRRDPRAVRSPPAFSVAWFAAVWTTILTFLGAYVHYGWLLFNNRVNARVGAQTKPYSKYRNQIVIIGDDTAFGYGDGLQLGGSPGIAGQLRRALQSDRYKLRQSWTIYNRGIYGTTSADWRPSSGETGSAKTKFQTVFDDPLYATAEIVILIVGFNDGRVKPEILPEDTVANISATCRALRTMGKEVWVLTVPTNGDEQKGDHFLEMNLRRNEILVNWLETCNDEGIKAGPRLDALHSEYRHKAFFSTDGEHFSAKGYRKIAKDLADLMPSSLIKKEFAKFSKDLKFH